MLQVILRAIRWILSCIASWFQSFYNAAGGGTTVTLDTGRQVRLVKQIAEGGFSFVFEAVDESDPNQRFALKRIRSNDPELLEACRKEANCHRLVAANHPNLMPLLGMSIVFQNRDSICYMLFPYMPHSLRAEVNKRTGLGQNQDNNNEPPSTRPPWDEVTALKLFLGIVDGVYSMHQAHYSHRDVKLENVLLDVSSSSKSLRPVLMDFGSAGPVLEPIESRRHVLELVEDASMHTTMPYRPPELFEGGVRSGDPAVDYRAVDVWSLGCTLFALLYGASPFESEFSRTSGMLKIVECTHLKLLGEVPSPPPHTPSSTWYSNDVQALYRYMLTQDRTKRPTLDEVTKTVEQLIQKAGGQVESRNVRLHYSNHDNDDDDVDKNNDFESLLKRDRNAI